MAVICDMYAMPLLLFYLATVPKSSSELISRGPNGVSYGNYSTISCIPGYYLPMFDLTSVNIVCSESAKWIPDPTDIECAPILCPPIALKQTGNRTGKVFQMCESLFLDIKMTGSSLTTNYLNDTITLSCKTGEWFEGLGNFDARYFHIPIITHCICYLL